jgi:hypothetical protein
MPAQVVGTSCALCGQRIGSIIEGGFCPDCGAPVHNHCAASPARREGPEACPSCGADRSALLADEEARQEEALREEPRVRPIIGFYTILLGLFFVVTGIFFSFLFTGLVVGAGVGRLVVATGLIGVGLGIVLRGIFLLHPSAGRWLLSVAALLLGTAFLGLYAFERLHGTTPENELTLVEGVPEDVALTEQAIRGRRPARFLKFTVGGYRTEYSEYRPRFEGVAEAVQSGRPLRVWVSTRRETLFPRAGWVPLYKMSVDEHNVLAYADVAGEQEGGNHLFLIPAAILIAAGAWGGYHSLRRRPRKGIS